MKTKQANLIYIVLVWAIVTILFFGIFSAIVYSNYSMDSGSPIQSNITITQLNENREHLNLPETDTNNDREITRANGGTLKWYIELGDEELSTPAICDLNPPGPGSNDKIYYEVVVAGAYDKICAIDSYGNPLWEFNDCVIDNARVLAQGLDFDPAPFFSSITPVDIAGGKGTELIVGEQDGVLCLKPDGTKLWGDKGTTDGYYFDSIAVTDIEGDFAGIDHEGNDVGYRDDLEIILGSDNNANADAFLECWQANGNSVFWYEVKVPFEHAFMTSSIVATEMDGYFFGDEKILKSVRESNPETLFQDFIMATHGYPGRIWKHHDGELWDEYYESATTKLSHFGGHETYATAVVGNFTGGSELEAIIGHGSGMATWQESDGTVRMYHQDGNEVCTAFHTGPAPSSVFSSPAVCNAQNIDERDLAPDEYIEYEIYFGADNGMVYCLSATDLSQLWSYQTGGRILSSPAVCNINSDDALEVVIGSNDGYVYCFEADPMEYDLNGNSNPKDDGYEDAGGDVGAYDILWTFDTKEIQGSSGEIGISSPVVGDIDRDGRLEVLIGDTGGMLYCIDAGGICIPGQIDWPKFHFDLNNTGFYNPGTTYGVDIYLTQSMIPEEPIETASKSVKPGETVTFNLTVKNIGISKTFDMAERFWLSTSQSIYKCGDFFNEHEWPAPKLKAANEGEKLYWDYPEYSNELRPYVSLRPNEMAHITLVVTAPWTGDLNELCQIEVLAQSENDSFAKDRILIEIGLEIILDFDINILLSKVTTQNDDLFGQKVLRVNPGDKATVEVEIENTGNLNDSYELMLDGIIWGWEAYFTNSANTLSTVGLLDAKIMQDQFQEKYRYNKEILKFEVIAPEDAQANEILTLRVHANSMYSKNSECIDLISKFDFLVIEVNPVPELELKCNSPRKYVVPGESVTFKVGVLNNGNSRLQVKLEHSQLEKGWKIEFRDDNNFPFSGQNVVIEVVNDGRVDVFVSLFAPINAHAGSSNNFIIKGSTFGNSSLISKDSIALTAIVSQTMAINVSVTPKNAKTDPGSIVNYYFIITNQGNGEDFILLSPAKFEVPWEVTFYIDNEERYSSKLPRNETIFFNVQVKIPLDQLAGVFTTVINVTSLGSREFVSFQTEINTIYNLSIYGIEYSKYSNEMLLTSILKPEPGVVLGTTLSFLIEITNNGNAKDWINLQVTPLNTIQSRVDIIGWYNFNKGDWSDFEELGWEAYFMGVTNSLTYSTDVEELDPIQELDLSPYASTSSTSTTFMNSGNRSLRDLNLRLGVGQTIWVTLQVIVPKNLPAIHEELHPKDGAPWYFNIDCYSTTGLGVNSDLNIFDNRVILILNISLPDLYLKDEKIQHPNKMTPGKIVTISAKILNIGENHAKDVVVTFYVDGKEIKSNSISLINVGQSRIIPFNWEVIEGEHELRIVVDPENMIVEQNEHNNLGTSEISVQPDNQWDQLLNNAEARYLFLIIIIVVILIILFLIYNIKIKKKMNRK